MNTNWLLRIIPPVLLDIYKRIRVNRIIYYFGEYDSWELAEDEANKYGKGYEEDGILERVAEATRAVREGKAVYEQDSVLFYEEHYIFEFLSAIYFILAHEKDLILCDIGGALGSTFYRYKSKLPMDRICWNIVEQKQFVDYGKKNIEDLSFYYNIEECSRDNPGMNTVFVLNTLQYLEDPYSMLDRIVSIDSVTYILLDEVVFNTHEDEDETIMLQHVPDSIYRAVYPLHVLRRSKLINYLGMRGIGLVFQWKWPEGNILIKRGFRLEESLCEGFLFVRIVK